uniref:Triadin n=1 Tax=Bursaphelenchus xylophilus TaxID=6326 RepID=A0A1I7RPS4_BURXY
MIKTLVAKVMSKPAGRKTKKSSTISADNIDKYTEKANRTGDLQKKKTRCVTVSTIMSVIAVWLIIWTVIAIVFDISSATYSV